jgi:phage repressor protein C with HTH and peptisase S24 domain
MTDRDEIDPDEVAGQAADDGPTAPAPGWVPLGPISFHQRLGAILSMEKSAAAFAKRAGLSQSGFHRIFRGGEPNLMSLIAIANAADVTIDWLAVGNAECLRDCHFEEIALRAALDDVGLHMSDGDLQREEFQNALSDQEMLKELLALNGEIRALHEKAENLSPGRRRRFGLFSSPGARAEGGAGYVGIPRYNAFLAAGHGSLNERAKLIDYIPFTRAFLVNKIGRSSPDGLVVLEARGDSMEPTIGDGDLVLIDQSMREPRDGLCAFVMGDTAHIKRLRFSVGGVDVISDNRELYPPERLSPEEGEGLSIIGRIRWIGRVV